MKNEVKKILGGVSEEKTGEKKGVENYLPYASHYVISGHFR